MRQPDPEVVEQLEIETLRLIESGGELDVRHLWPLDQLLSKGHVRCHHSLTEAGRVRVEIADETNRLPAGGPPTTGGVSMSEQAREIERLTSMGTLALAVPTRLRRIADEYYKDGRTGPRGVGIWGRAGIAEELRKVADEIEGDAPAASPALASQPVPSGPGGGPKTP